MKSQLQILSKGKENQRTNERKEEIPIEFFLKAHSAGGSFHSAPFPLPQTAGCVLPPHLSLSFADCGGSVFGFSWVSSMCVQNQLSLESLRSWHMPSFVLNYQLLLIGTRRSNELTLKAVDSRVDEEINSWDILTIASSPGSWKRTAVLISIFPSIKERNRTV